MKSASFIIAALIASVSASEGDTITAPVAGTDAPKEPNNFWLHVDAARSGSSSGFRVCYKKTSPCILATGSDDPS